MFKKIIYIVTIISLFLFLNSCSNDKTKIVKKPILSECNIKSFDYKFGNLDTTVQKTTFIKYDSLGNIIEEMTKGKFGKIKNYRKTDYKYYPNGKIHTIIIYNDAGEPFAKYISYYDSNGVKIKEDSYTKKNEENYTDDKFITTTFRYKDTLLVEELASPSNTRYVHTYDEKGHKKEDKTYYDNENYPSWITKYKCDANGNIIYYESYYAEGKKYKNTRLYKYDSLNRKIQEISLDKNDKQVFRTTYTYDKNNRIIESTEYGPLDEPVSLSKYNYIFK